MTAEERAADILRRCWWRSEEHPGEERPIFQGLDLEIADAIRAAVTEEREACKATACGWSGRRLEGHDHTQPADAAFGRGVDMASYYIAAAIGERGS